MEDLHKYIQEARQNGYSDEQIETSLIEAGWNHDQIAEAIKPNLKKSNKRGRIRLIAAVSIIVFAVIIAGVSVFAIHKHNVANQPLSVTLYYSDGRTPLYQGNNFTQPGIKSSFSLSFNAAFTEKALISLKEQFADSNWRHGNYKVTTTLNLNLQNLAEKDIQNNVNNVASVGGNEQAMVAEDVKTGQIVAYIGNSSPTNSTDGRINYASALMSPGSSLQPFVYAALIQNDNNVGAGTALDDSQGPLPGWPCTDESAPSLNTDGGNCLWDNNYIYPGQVTLRYALAGSRNVPAVKASYEEIPASQSAIVGANNGTVTPTDIKSVDKWIAMANQSIGDSNAYACYKVGIAIFAATAADQAQCYGSAALGAGYINLNNEINGDATFARLGQEIPETYILNITDSSGKTIYQWQQPKSNQVYSPDTAYIINNILDDPSASYLSAAQKFQHYNGWDIAVKAGTENDSRNGVMTAWSTQYAVVGFAGSATLSRQLAEGHFEDITEPITRTWMEQALTALHTRPINWVQPKDVKVLSAYVQPAFSDYGAVFPGPSTDLYPSWYK